MKKISETIYEENIELNENVKLRETVRAVILNEKDEVFMLYSKLYNDYTFPGGGIKPLEKHMEGLKRELKEEVGAVDIDVLSPLGYIEEIRYGINSSNNVYRQKSYYYLCNINEIGETNYVGHENEQGLEMRWVSIDEVIDHNEKVNNLRDEELNKGFKTVLIRENAVLNYIKGNLWEDLK